jgi:hypothetical protein
VGPRVRRPAQAQAGWLANAAAEPPAQAGWPGRQRSNPDQAWYTAADDFATSPNCFRRAAGSDAVPVWDPPAPPQPKQSLRARFGFGKKAEQPDSQSVAPAAQQPPPATTPAPTTATPAAPVAPNARGQCTSTTGSCGGKAAAWNSARAAPQPKEPELRLLRLRVLRPPASPPRPRPKPVPRRQPHSRACPSRRAVRTSPPVRRPHRGPSLPHPAPGSDTRSYRARTASQDAGARTSWSARPIPSPGTSSSAQGFNDRLGRRPLRQLQISPTPEAHHATKPKVGVARRTERRGCDSRGSTRGR